MTIVKTLLKDMLGDTIQIKGVNQMKGTPKRDGSGKGIRANKGRGGCANPMRKGKGSNRK